MAEVMDKSNVAEIESELQDFYNYCKTNDLTDDQIAEICSPLATKLNKFSWNRLVRPIVIVLLIATTVIVASYFDLVSWNLAAVGRLFMIELLPFWNWKMLKTEKCLIPNVNSEAMEVAPDCTFCEYLNGVDVADAFNPESIFENYIKLNKPVILENGFKNWKTVEANASLLNVLFDDPTLSKSFPCKYSSNIYHGNGDFFDSLKRHRDHNVYFVHLQNCEFDAVKAFRKYFPRPNFLPPEIYPIQYSWLVHSKNYKVDKYKTLTFDDNVMVFGQVAGRTEIILQSEPCRDDCPLLRMTIARGEVLIFTNQWSFSYLPQGEGESFAVILETH